MPVGEGFCVRLTEVGGPSLNVGGTQLRSWAAYKERVDWAPTFTYPCFLTVHIM